MKHIQTIETRDLCQSAKNGCKTSCGIANQACEKKNND